MILVYGMVSILWVKALRALYWRRCVPCIGGVACPVLEALRATPLQIHYLHQFPVFNPLRTNITQSFLLILLVFAIRSFEIINL